MSEATTDEQRLEEAQKAFDLGNYERMRILADALAKSETPEIREKASTLQQRIGIDPMQIAVIVGCSVFFLLIAYTYVF